MTIDIPWGGQSRRFVLTTLCSYGEYGDFQAFPTSPLALEVLELGTRLKATGRCRELRSDGKRLRLVLEEATITLQHNGRTVLENVRPDSQTAAQRVLELLFDLLGQS
ncbi:MAG: hypothetical protein RBU37_23400 [Myxococcota bacterium]|jgi:hypothetical protein|nr:hypothetical protein [Myxococcota bacterium]